jgi:hypothetical protein
MEPDKILTTSRQKERLFILLIAVLFLFLFFRLFTVLQLRFADVDKRLQDGTMVNLNSSDPAGKIHNLLTKGYYFDDKRDVELITATIGNNIGIGDKIDNVGELNKRKYYIIADDAFAKGGKSFKGRVTASRSLLGYTGDDSVRFIQERKNPPSLPSVNNLAMGNYSISGSIVNEKLPVPGVLIRLDMILPQDSIYNDELTEDVKPITENG